MQFGINAQAEFAGEWLVRIFSSFSAESKVIFHRIGQRLSQFLDGCAFKGDDVAGIDNFAMENTRVVVNFYSRYVTLILHHGLIPASIKNRLTERIVGRLVSFCGWGR